MEIVGGREGTKAIGIPPSAPVVTPLETNVLSTVTRRHRVYRQLALEDFPLLTKGLVWSLSCSHLVSAGTLAYRACLKDIDESDWILFFMPAIEVVVTTENDNDISTSKTSTAPTTAEFLMISSFLIENVNTDNAAFRQIIFNSFVLFLIRIRRPCTLSGLLLCCAEWQAQLLQQDLWQAASSGAPLHGLLTALSLVAAHPTGAEISILNAAEVERLVCLMERVVAHLLSVLASKANNITNFAPSFAEMAEAIDSTFCDILSRDEEEVMDTTPAHQLVINCIWFNLKACCNLSSELASIESTASDIAERCGLLIVRVLKQCRHKGVIESAGMSLSNLIKMMTSNKCMRACHDLPERILTEFLDVLQEGVQHMEDITNPFDHGVRNIYAEETKVIDLFAQSLLTFVQSSKNSELIELKKFASVRAESYDTDIEYVLQLLGKKFDQGLYLNRATESGQIAALSARRSWKGLPSPSTPTPTYHPGPGPLNHTDTTNTTKFSKI
uniref:DUF2428 domain-containing protein n=1 Tax=Timema poppense TaxID=170557 RepID=A0A7R9CG16_TIMPO|nr:unnamed protein product [Timema poppensis]